MSRKGDKGQKNENKLNQRSKPSSAFQPSANQTFAKAAAKKKRLKNEGSSSRVPNQQAHMRAPRRKPSGYRRFLIRVFAALEKMSNQTSTFFQRVLGNDRTGKALATVGVIILLLFVGSFTFWFFTNKNAYEVSVGGVKLDGLIAFDKKLTAEELTKNAINKLAAEVKSKVEVKETVEIKPVHTSKKQIVEVEHMLTEIYKSFTYTVEVAIITVDGDEMAVLKNAEDAEAVQNRLKDEFRNDDPTIIDATFVEDVKVVNKFVEPSEIISVDAAYAKLNVKKETEQTYVVKSGDKLWLISAEFGVPLQSIYDWNPGITDNLKIGQEIKLYVKKPLLSVKTLQEYKYKEVEPKLVETRYNNQKAKSEKTVIKAGKDGEREVTAHIVRINGIETGERLIIDTVSITQAETEIIEVGTK